MLEVEVLEYSVLLENLNQGVLCKLLGGLST